MSFYRKVASLFDVLGVGICGLTGNWGGVALFGAWLLYDLAAAIIETVKQSRPTGA